jgi:hypothetical protein
MVGLAIALLVCMWAGIFRELKNAPEVDENGNIIKKDKIEKK